jgi:hypothetical protein
LKNSDGQVSEKDSSKDYHLKGCIVEQKGKINVSGSRLHEKGIVGFTYN